MESDLLKIFFLPFPAPGHMIPMVDTARVFAMRSDVDVTIVTTEANAPSFQKSIDRDSASGHNIKTHVLHVPSEILENAQPRMIPPDLSLIKNTVEQLFRDLKPDCIVTDIFYPWTAEATAKLGIPRLIFHGSYFFVCARHCVRCYEPHKAVESDDETFSLPGLPHDIKMTRLQLPEWVRTRTAYTDMMDVILEAEGKAYGAVVNSFHDLESAYEEHYKSSVGMKAWTVGPVSLMANNDREDKMGRGKKSSVEDDELLNWLNSKQDDSVLYVSFGSMTRFPAAQLIEIAHALEASGYPFIWVVRKRDSDGDDKGEKWLPEGFEQRMTETQQGLIIRDWAPQLLILEHPATGGIVTHCGWNTLLESVSAGVPMVTWPLFAEQFYNEKLLTEVLKIGVSVGVKGWSNWTKEATEVVKREEITKAVALLMSGGEEATEMRKRVRELASAAKRGLEHGGDSWASLTALIDELKSMKNGGAREFLEAE